MAPLFADGPVEARALVAALRSDLRPDEPVQLDLPVPNSAAAQLGECLEKELRALRTRIP
jgi:hypothetical protein